MPAKKRPSKSKAKSSRRARRKASNVGAPGRLKFIAVVLLLLAVGGIVGVRYLDSPRGRAALLDRGKVTYYAQVQEETGAALKRALGRFGLRRAVTESAGTMTVDGNRVRPLRWDIRCPESVNLVKLNLALTRAAASTGARVRKSEEIDDGRGLAFVVGTRRYDTHRLTIRKPGPQEPAAEPRARRPKLALVIDDFGYNDNDVADEILSLDLPLTISILPTLPYSERMLERAKALGRCTLLHLPMEPEEAIRTDIPPVTTSMSGNEIETMVRTYVEQMPGIDGVNNHQGSLATADGRVMRAVLDVLSRDHLFFLDSLTSPKSVAYNTARELGVPTARNDLFIDADTEDPDVVEERLRRLVDTAKRHGEAVGIGHPHRWTLEAIKASRGYLEGAGVDLVYVSDLME